MHFCSCCFVDIVIFAGTLFVTKNKHRFFSDFDNVDSDPEIAMQKVHQIVSKIVEDNLGESLYWVRC